LKRRRELIGKGCVCGADKREVEVVFIGGIPWLCCVKGSLNS